MISRIILLAEVSPVPSSLLHKDGFRSFLELYKVHVLRRNSHQQYLVSLG